MYHSCMAKRHGGHWHGRRNWERQAFIVPVNILETDSEYEMWVLAPGRNKEDFEIQVRKNILTISYKAPKEEETGLRWAKREYRTVSFSRSFSLDETIDLDQIKADYREGILYIKLPIKPEAVQPTQEIVVN